MLKKIIISVLIICLSELVVADTKIYTNKDIELLNDADTSIDESPYKFPYRKLKNVVESSTSIAEIPLVVEALNKTLPDKVVTIKEEEPFINADLALLSIISKNLIPKLFSFPEFSLAKLANSPSEEMLKVAWELMHEPNDSKTTEIQSELEKDNTPFLKALIVDLTSNNYYQMHPHKLKPALLDSSVVVSLTACNKYLDKSWSALEEVALKVLKVTNYKELSICLFYHTIKKYPVEAITYLLNQLDEAKRSKEDVRSVNLAITQGLPFNYGYSDRAYPPQVDNDLSCKQTKTLWTEFISVCKDRLEQKEVFLANDPIFLSFADYFKTGKFSNISPCVKEAEVDSAKIVKRAFESTTNTCMAESVDLTFAKHLESKNLNEGIAELEAWFALEFKDVRDESGTYQIDAHCLMDKFAVAYWALISRLPKTQTYDKVLSFMENNNKPVFDSIELKLNQLSTNKLIVGDPDEVLKHLNNEDKTKRKLALKLAYRLINQNPDIKLKLIDLLLNDPIYEIRSDILFDGLSTHNLSRREASLIQLRTLKTEKNEFLRDYIMRSLSNSSAFEKQDLSLVLNELINAKEFDAQKAIALASFAILSDRSSCGDIIDYTKMKEEDFLEAKDIAVRLSKDVNLRVMESLETKWGEWWKDKQVSFKAYKKCEIISCG